MQKFTCTRGVTGLEYVRDEGEGEGSEGRDKVFEGGTEEAGKKRTEFWRKRKEIFMQRREYLRGRRGKLKTLGKK